MALLVDDQIFFLAFIFVNHCRSCNRFELVVVHVQTVWRNLTKVLAFTIAGVECVEASVLSLV